MTSFILLLRCFLYTFLIFVRYKRFCAFLYLWNLFVKKKKKKKEFKTDLITSFILLLTMERFPIIVNDWKSLYSKNAPP